MSLWWKYVFNKQTLRELTNDYGIDWRTLRTHFDAIVLPIKVHNPRPIHLVVDTTYFGKKRNKSSWGVMLFRDVDKGENLWWEFCDREGVLGYAKGRRFLEEQGYTILSVTTDGFRGLVDVFHGIPFQACHFHMKQTCIRHLTLKP